MIETSIPGLTLSPVEPADGGVIWRVLSEPDVGEQVNPAWELASSANYGPLIGWVAGNRVWSICKNGQVIGVYVLGELDYRNRSARILCNALTREVKKLGYGKAIIQAVLNWCWQEGFQRVWFTTIVDKSKTANRVQALGGVFEGTDRAALLCHGRLIDQHRFAYLKGE